MFDQLTDVIILGLIQGLAEWLPISSTAHLRIAEHFLALTTTPLFNVTLHTGTLIVVLFYFRKDVKSILSSIINLDTKSESGRLIFPIIIATIPTAIVGLIYVEFLEANLQTFLIIGITFLLGATMLFISRTREETTEKVTYTTALIMGVAQGFAIFPGLSRSGVTISTALLLGLKREKAFRFSFLLSIPAVAGDLIVEAYNQRLQFSTLGIGPLQTLVGTVFAVIAGYAAIRIVSKLVLSRKFHYFSVYTMALGIILVILAVMGITI